MKKLFLAFLLLFPALVLSGGLNASFSGANLDNFPGADESTIFEYNATQAQSFGTSGEFRDKWENLVTYSNAFDSWTPGNASVVANQYKNPVTREKDADVLHEDSAAGWHNLDHGTATVLVIGHNYTYSVYARKLAKTWMFLSNSAGGNVGGSFDVGNAVSGTMQANVLGAIVRRIDTEWVRVGINFNAAAANFYMGIASCTGDTSVNCNYTGSNADSLAFYGAQVVDNTDGTIVGPGRPIQTGATSKPRLDLTASVAGIPHVLSSLQGANGNRLSGVSLDQSVDQHYSHAASDAVNVMDQDCTFTFILNATSTGSGQDTIYAHLTGGNSGGQIYIDNTQVVSQWGKNPAAILAVKTGLTTHDGLTHVLQIVRSSNMATVYWDGSPGTSADVTGAGVDVSTAFWLAEYPGETTYG